jgi:hypothetical protein
VCEAEQHFVDDAVRTDGAGDRDGFGIGRIRKKEVMLVEIVQLVIADPAGQGRYVVDIGLEDHRLHIGFEVA